MKIFSQIIILLYFAQVALAQSHPYEVKFSHQIEKEIATEQIRPSRAGLLYSLIGDYQNSIRYSETPVSWKVDSLEFNNYDIKAALPLIVKQAKNNSIVIISENHLKPQHRIFANKVIKELAKLGYKHLGLETFTNVSNSNILLDSKLNSRGYPLDSPLTGTYTLEPKMGELVRSAIQLDYELFAYERSEKIEGKDRDEIQADNIIKYIENHPNSKVVILCGLHHAVEANIIKRGKSYWMANYLKKKLNIDLLTIYQDNFTEKIIENEHPILNSLNINLPSTFINKKDGSTKITEYVDIEIIHPKTTYLNGRPNWLYQDKRYKAVAIKSKDSGLNFPLMVSAYPVEEVNSVPLDRIELKHKYDRKVLVLKEGEYRIVLNDGENKLEYIKTVE